MPSSVKRSIRLNGQSGIVAILATTGRFSLSTTALARIDLNVSEASCMTNAPDMPRPVQGKVALQSGKPRKNCKGTHRYTFEMAVRHAHPDGRDSRTHRGRGL